MKIGRFGIEGRTVLIPPMAPFGSRLLAASFRAFGVPATVLETYRDLAIGREHTSGKECFPCQVTLGDLLGHLKREEERLGSSFDAGRYAYFMPGAEGPCRFGMYSLYQKMVLDRFPRYRDMPILRLSTGDAYATSGLLPGRHARGFKKLAVHASMTGDLLDRMVWRARPYESVPGSTDRLARGTLESLEEAIARDGSCLDFTRFEDLLAEAAGGFRSLIDSDRPRRPRIGIVGEIFLRSHPDSNGNIARGIEEFGGEVTVASFGEWLLYVTERKAGEGRRRAGRAVARMRPSEAGRCLLDWLSLESERAYVKWTRRRVYRAVRGRVDVTREHGMGRLRKLAEQGGLFSFDLGTEAPLSIGGALEQVVEGYHGIVNVYPFTCMPGALASGILGPRLRELGVPYLDAPCDGTRQPNRDTALRTFLYQARQYMEGLSGPRRRVSRTS